MCIEKTSRGRIRKTRRRRISKMPFKDVFWEGEKTLRSTTFPDNLRLRPGYLISQSDGPIKKDKK